MVCACLYEKQSNNLKKCDEVKKKIKKYITKAELYLYNDEIINRIKNISYLVLRDAYGDDRIFQKENYKEKIDSYFEGIDSTV